jgi:predicted GIY-YIG superfamily endonuclease
VEALGDEIKLSHGGKKIVVPKKAVATTCSYGYADTVMRIISRTIPGCFNIWQADKMDWNEMFVALSRARTAANIGMDFDNGALLKKYKMAAPPAKGIRIKLEPELRLGFIYRRTDGEKEYIGSTWDMESREEEHQSNPVSKKCEAWQDAQGDKIKMELVESWMCLTEKQSVSREYELIALVPEDKCMNTNGVAKAAKKEAETKIEKLEIEHERFKIVDDEKEKAWRIQWKEDGKSQCKKMRYQRRGKEITLKEMEEFRMELIKKTFL